MNAATNQGLTLENFEAGKIDSQSFDHQSHVYIAWLFVQRFELSDAIKRFAAALRRLVVKLGAQDKYHATITRFFLLLIAERSSGIESWTAFCDANPDLTTNSSAILSRYYTDDALFSNDARSRFVLLKKLARGKD